MGSSNKSTAGLVTNGLIAPNDFPRTAYEDIHRIIESKRAGHPLYDHYAGAWNAVAYRFVATGDYGDTFAASINAHGTAPPPAERYLQEKALFGFFSNGFSTFESVFYGLYAIGAFIVPSKFPLSTPKEQQQVSPSRTRDAYEAAFPDDPILKTFTALFSDAAFQRWRETRNILTHRTAPGRRMYVSIGVDEAPPAEWKLSNVPLDATIASQNRQDLARLLVQLLTAAADFVARRVS